MGVDRETILKIKHVFKSEVHKGKETSPQHPQIGSILGVVIPPKSQNLWDKSASGKHGPN
jgi:hypothetical protein